MRVWRIANARYALDRSCLQTARFGGRWNPIGTAVLYAADSVSLAALERFVHLEGAPWPGQLLVAVDLPEESEIYRPALEDLPAGWDAMPTSSAAQSFGAAWVKSGSSLAMAVPSVIAPEECNVLVNPSHLDFARVTMNVVRPFDYDQRMRKKG